MQVNASKLFRSPVPGVFTPRSSEWNSTHRRNFFPPALWIRRRSSNLRIRGPAGMAGFSSMARGSMGFRMRPYQPARRAGVLGRLAPPIARGLACLPRNHSNPYPKCLPAYAVTPQEEGSGGSEIR